MTKHDADRKARILDFIAATLRTRGFPPSVREIAKAVGLASTSAVHHHLLILERRVASDVGIRSGAEPLGQARADLQLRRRAAGRRRSHRGRGSVEGAARKYMVPPPG